MSFVLTPPMIVSEDLGFAIIQTCDMLSAESLVIKMASWTSLQLLSHWHSEVNELLASRRDRCCLVSGLALKRRAVVPTEWWTLHLIDGRIKMHYQVILSDQIPALLKPDLWWTKILPYDRNVSEWPIELNDLTQWSKQCEVLFNAMNAVKND